jgi:hypothetical protein
MIQPNDLAAELAGHFFRVDGVEAVALAGSRIASPDPASDIDLYVYTRRDIPVAEREAIMNRVGGASLANLGLNYWGAGDEWYHAPTGIEVDSMYFEADWMQARIESVMVDHRASEGYTTCFCYTVRNSKIFYDPNGWFARLQDLAGQPYPEELRRNIIALNYPLLRGIIPAYGHQAEKAARRGDLVSVNHRLAALLACYFDILFAFNHVLHPGEKRLVSLALERCERVPEHMADDVSAVLRLAGSGGEAFVNDLNRLLDRLDALLA